MPEPSHAKIKRSLEQAQALYHRLVLLVGKAGSGKTNLLRVLASELGVDVINVNLALSATLIELTERQRILHLSTLFDEVVEKAGTVALLDNIEILFDHSLRQDPIRLLQGVSRKRCIMASWSGSITGNSLSYAEAGHPEYRSYDVTGTLIVDINEVPGLDAWGGRQT